VDIYHRSSPLSLSLFVPVWSSTSSLKEAIDQEKPADASTGPVIFRMGLGAISSVPETGGPEKEGSAGGNI
jgi:hypothetical protein